MPEHEHRWQYTNGSFFHDHRTLHRSEGYLVRLRCECGAKLVRWHRPEAIPVDFPDADFQSPLVKSLIDRYCAARLA